jgi:hypothetical protein
MEFSKQSNVKKQEYWNHVYKNPKSYAKQNLQKQ